MSLGKQVGRELDAAEFALEVFGEDLDRAGFGESGQALHEDVAVGEDGEDEALDGFELADDARVDALLEIEDLVAGGHGIMESPP